MKRKKQIEEQTVQPKQKIPIKCSYDALYQYSDLASTQGALKKITRADTEKLTNSILNNGVVFPIYVWKHKGKNQIIGGHHRSYVIDQLQKQGYDIEGIPAIHVQATSFDEAKKFVLLDSAQYAKVDKKTFGDFLGSLKLDGILSEVSNKEIELSDVTKKFFNVRYDLEKTASAPMKTRIVAAALTGDEYKKLMVKIHPLTFSQFVRNLIS